MKHVLAILLLCITGCAASTTGDETGAARDPKACEDDGVAATAAPCEAQPAAAEAPAPVTVVETVGTRVVSNDLGPDNVQ